MRKRRVGVLVVLLMGLLALIIMRPQFFQQAVDEVAAPLIDTVDSSGASSSALEKLNALEVKGRAAKTGYARTEFGNGWGKIQGCSVRQVILVRDLKQVVMKDECTVESGVLDDPYTGETIHFNRAQSAAVQIDHVVALSDAWQKGAQYLSKEHRIALANDSLNLLASDGPANQQKGDADAATWLPKNKAFRCAYIERQIEVKAAYQLWVTPAEKEAMVRVLSSC